MISIARYLFPRLLPAPRVAAIPLNIRQCPVFSILLRRHSFWIVSYLYDPKCAAGIDILHARERQQQAANFKNMMVSEQSSVSKCIFFRIVAILQ